jgi:hypothetical protein
MTGLEYVNRAVMPAAYVLLPPGMNAPGATAMLLTIGLQESRFIYRKQMNDGPAHSFWQGERGGGMCLGILTHPATRDIIVPLCREAFQISPTPQAIWNAIIHNDILAVVCARLLLYTVPLPLPKVNEVEAGWQNYVSGWRPGKPHRETWDRFYTLAWKTVGYEVR